jgi:hypothetical protein
MTHEQMKPFREHPLWPAFEEACQKEGISVGDLQEFGRPWRLFLAGADVQSRRDRDPVLTRLNDAAVRQGRELRTGDQIEFKTCPACDGNSGDGHGEPCGVCLGTGSVRKT